MPKRRRLLSSPMKNKAKLVSKRQNELSETNITNADDEMWSARGRLKGALLEVLDPAEEESDDTSVDQSPLKRDRQSSDERRVDVISDEEERDGLRPFPPRASYVLKLFDRSVDLSQFTDNSPLYPICRAWIANQPKANYKTFGKKAEPVEVSEDSIELPGPSGPPISRIPELLPEQKACSKDNINLNYKVSPPPSLQQLINEHSRRWSGVRRAWLDQAAAVEARYARSQQILNDISANSV